MTTSTESELKLLIKENEELFNKYFKIRLGYCVLNF